MTENTTQIIKATLELQQRVGTGTLDPVLLQKCQRVMNLHRTEFLPVAAPYLDHLQLALARAENTSVPVASRIRGLVQPVMDLKANGAMFGYELVTDLANVMLGFLENIDTIDDDVIDLVYAHYRTLRAMIERRMMGKGGASGQQLVRELKEACARYINKHKKGT